MSVCQVSPYLQNNGPRLSASCGNVQTYTLDRKIVANDSSKLFYGSLAQVDSGDCFRPSTASGTASTNDSPDGATGMYGSECTSISSKNPTWSISSSTARSFGLTSALLAHPGKGGATVSGTRKKPRRVQHQDPRERGRTWQSTEIHADRRTQARHHSG